LSQAGSKQVFVAKQILIITPDVNFSIQAQQALQRNGEFVVNTFVRAGEALSFLKDNPQDVALVDFRVTDMVGQRLVHHIRSLHPDIAVILAPNTPTTRGFKNESDLQAVIDIPYSLRKLVTLLRNAANGNEDNHADTEKGMSQQVTDEDMLMRNYAQTLEFWVDEDTGRVRLEYPPLPDDIDETVPDSTFSTDSAGEHTFQKLAAEEPPMPSFEDGSTVRDLVASLTHPDTRQRVLDALDDAELDETAPAPDDEFLDDRDENPAVLILETAVDQTTPIKTFSLSEFMTRVQERRLPGEALILPLPSWVEESERYVREPDFLKESLPGFGEPLEYTSSTTVPHARGDTQVNPGELVTDPIEPIRRSHPPESLPEVEAPEPEPEMPDTLPESPPEAPPESDTAPDESLAPEPDEVELGVTDETDTEEPADGVPYYDYITDDPRIAQMALMLTQMSLDVAADATLLARNGQLVAYAGRLPRPDIDALRAQVEDWETDAEHSRIRFLTLPETSTDYMLYSRRTTDNLTLSLIFAGDLPLSHIRKQSRRLLEALESVPDVIEEEDESAEVALESIEPEVEVDTWFPATYLWLLRAPDGALPDDAVAHLQHEMHRELLRLGWKIDALDVEADMVYLFADVPETDNRAQVIDTLMQQSAAILHERFPALATESLWADSYFVLHPGRALSVEERQRFINFVRG
jgi:CheY-like chemotaxis protein